MHSGDGAGLGARTDRQLVDRRAQRHDPLPRRSSPRPLIGLVMLPFNLTHLGTAEYGLWMLLGSITVHFSVLDLGYGGAIVKFVAQYRAHRDARALNEIASTLFFIFTGIGAARLR